MNKALPSIKDLIKNNYVTFSHYRAGHLYYLINDLTSENEDQYIFPVPIEDIGDATFPCTDKAMFFMRYIRKAMNDNTLVLNV